MFLIRIGFVFLLFVGLSACSGPPYGFLYSDVTRPLTTDMHDTSFGTKETTSSSHSIRIPVSSTAIGADWNSYGIGDAAKRGGIEGIDFADLRTQSVLLGIWKRQTVTVHGR